MHEENRFFRVLWRINAILLALAGLLAVVLLCVAAAGLLISGFGRHDETVPVKSTAVDKIHFEFATENLPLQGTAFILYTLNKVRDSEANEGEGSGSFSGGRYNPRQDANYLVVDSAAASGLWLFPHETQAIWERILLYKTPSADGGDAVTAMILTVADGDTNKDGALSQADRPALYYYRLGDAHAVKFFSPDGIWSVRQVDAESFCVIFENGGKKGVAVFSTHDFTLLRKGELPDYPK